MKVWVTKYALTQGIFEAEAERFEETPMVTVRGKNGAFDAHYHKPYWHESAEEARLHVLKMCEAKLKSLHKAMAKVKKVMGDHQ